MKKNYTHLSALIDRSGSMNSIREDMQGGFNQLIEDQKKVEGEMTVTIALFDHHDGKLQYDILNEFVSVNEAIALDNANYVPRGGTPLNDSLAKLITETGAKLASIAEEDRPEKVLIVCVTDGQNNGIQEYTTEQVKAMIEEQERKYGWKFMYIGANQDSFTEGAIRGFGATYDFNATKSGTSKMSKVFSSTLSSYRSSSVSTSVDLASLLKKEADRANIEENDLSGK